MLVVIFEPQSNVKVWSSGHPVESAVWGVLFEVFGVCDEPVTVVVGVGIGATAELVVLIVTLRLVVKLGLIVKLGLVVKLGLIVFEAVKLSVDVGVSLEENLFIESVLFLFIYVD